MRAVVAVFNAKGGSAKTTTVRDLGAALVERRQAVTLLDLDPQRSLVLSLGERPDPLEVRAVADASRLTAYIRPEGWTLLDCPPGLTSETRRALAAADAYLIPVPPSYHAMIAVESAMQQAREINPRAGLVGILLVAVDRTTVARAVADELRRRFPGAVLRSWIPRSVALEKAHAAHQTILDFDPEGPGARAYRLLAREVMRRARNR